MYSHETAELKFRTPVFLRKSYNQELNLLPNYKGSIMGKFVLPFLPSLLYQLWERGQLTAMIYTKDKTQVVVKTVNPNFGTEEAYRMEG